MYLQGWRNLMILNTTVTQSTRLAAAATHLASLPSTNAFFTKWKNNFSSGVPRDEQSPKIRFTVREKLPNSKKAFNDYNRVCSSSSHELTDRPNKKARVKPSHHLKIAAQRKLKRKHRRENPFDDNDNDPAKSFFAAFGKEGSNFNFRRWEQRSEWKQNSDSNSATHANRKILGLPETGPLKIEDVKTAFRSSALKWHPDRHQRAARAAAEEQFKHCVDAYKSLCATLSSR